jgi:exosortase family protein XrtF
MSDWKQFKPSILFVLKFVGLYILLNLLYAAYLYVYNDQADPMTLLVTEQTAAIIDLYESGIDTRANENGRSWYVTKDGSPVLSVYEGCNGLNMMIIFVVFLFAYSTWHKKFIWFIPLGLVMIHLFNLLRIVLLFHVTIDYPKALYFSHKYAFTAFIFLAVFILWYLWIAKLETTLKTKSA